MSNAINKPVWEDVLDFWFGEPGSAASAGSRKEWFQKDAAFDAAIRARFATLHTQLMAGDHADWEQTPLALLAKIVVLDQFSRNMLRDTPAAFASDPVALRAAQLMVANGWDSKLAPLKRWFVYLPYEHSEDRAVQADSMRLFTALAQEPGQADVLKWARAHTEIIERFGRYPHRNAILGRVSTAEELAFLATPGSSF